MGIGRALYGLALAILVTNMATACGGVAMRDPKADAIAQAVAQQQTSEGSMDTMCRAYTVIAAALKGGDSTNLKDTTWSAWSEDPQERAWSVSCDGTYTVLTQKGEEVVTERIFLFLVDYDKWELGYVPGRTDEIQLLGTWGVYLPMKLDPGRKP